MARYLVHFLPLLLLASFASAATDWARKQCGPADIITHWGKQVNPGQVLPEYPRPQLVRPNNTWENLNGLWEFEPGSPSDPIPFGRVLSENILVPFPVESCLSGIGTTYQYLWYRLIFDQPANFTSAKTLLNFGAVDWQCSVWVNTNWVGNHTGGYDYFSFDVTAFIQDTNNELIVFVYDPSNNGSQPSGKQYIPAIANPEKTRYTPASGIWQTVWLENVPETYISNLRIFSNMHALTITTFTTPDNTGPLYGITNSGTDLPETPTTLVNNSHWECYQMCQKESRCVAWSFEIPLCGGAAQPRCWLKGTPGSIEENYCRISGSRGQPIPVNYNVYDGLNVVATGSGFSGVAITIPIPNPKLWTPTSESPFLYTIHISISSETIHSYFGMRSISLGSYSHPAIPDTGPQVGIDRSGSDIPGSPFSLSSNDYNLCHDKCKNTQGCVSWAYAIPNCGGQGPQFACWLKSSTPSLTPNPCRVSGDLEIHAFSTMRPQLNGKYMFYAGWLDQSYWPDGIYTAPTNEAVASDLHAVKTFGLNSVRLHQKINPERWYWYADSLGIAVMQDMVQKIGATSTTIDFFIVDLYKMIDNKYNHPSIVQWQVFSDADCIEAFNSTQITQVAQIVADLDPSRLFDFNPGGPANNIGYGDVNSVPSFPYPSRPFASSTQYGAILYGGIGTFTTGKEWQPNVCWSYLNVDTSDQGANCYIDMINIIAQYTLSACIYLQITDVETECDGFLNYDRTNKFNTTQMQTIFNINQALIKNSTLVDNRSTDNTIEKLLKKLVYFVGPCFIVVLLLLTMGITLKCYIKRKQRNKTDSQVDTPRTPLLSSDSINNMLYTANLLSHEKIFNDTTQVTYLINPITQTSFAIGGREGEAESQIRVEGEEGVGGETVFGQQILPHQINIEPSTYNMDFDNEEDDEKVLQFLQTFD